MKGILKVFLAGLVLSCVAFNACLAAEHNLEQAIAWAKRSNKMLFIMYGREACGNCQHLKKMIRDGKVKISASEFIIVDINCDDKKQSAVFQSKYPSLSGGGYLPFVVIAKPDGTCIVSRKGYGEAADYEKMIREAKKK